MKINKALHGIRTLKEAKDKPGGFIIDLILETILSAIIPIPFVAGVVVRYKKTILIGLGGLFVLGLLFITLFTTALLYPIRLLTLPFGGSQTTMLSGQLLQSLSGYIEAGFSDTDTPSRNPFGGVGMLNVYTTVSYHEQEDFTFNGEAYSEIEQGIDIVPDGLYYLTNKAAKITNQPIIFTTMNGTANTLVDGYGANYVVVTNNSNTIRTLYFHLSQFLIADNSTVKAGEPIGIMGSTGLSTGAHLEYQVRLNQGGTWVTANPSNYIQ